jgi:hypothetical protein
MSFGEFTLEEAVDLLQDRLCNGDELDVENIAFFCLHLKQTKKIF